VAETAELFRLLALTAETSELLRETVLGLPTPRSEKEEGCRRRGRGVAEMMKSISGLVERSALDAADGSEFFGVGRGGKAGDTGGWSAGRTGDLGVLLLPLRARKAFL
jgi:hypothetical protein